MSLIGSLEHFKLAAVLDRLERHAKTGLLVIQQGRTWVELYFRNGQLMCIGPVRTHASLGERLLQDNIISPQALQKVLRAIGDEATEVTIAITLINLGYTAKEKLRSWSMQKVLDVLQVLLAWPGGDIYFDEDIPTPPDRLLAAFSVSALLAVVQPLETAATEHATPAVVMHQPEQVSPTIFPVTPAPDISRIKTLMGASYYPAEGDSPIQISPSRSFLSSEPQVAPVAAQNLIDPGAFTPRSLPASELDVQPLSFRASEAISQPLSAQSLFDADVLPSSFGAQPLPSTGPMGVEPDDAGAFSSLFADATESSPASFSAPQQSSPSSFAPPQPITIPIQPRYVDTSYMRPDMILMPGDLTAHSSSPAFIALTPDQWRLLTKVDGKTSLQAACQELSMTPEWLCQVAGELAGERLIQLVSPAAMGAQELSPASREMLASGLGHGYVAPGSAAAPAQPWSASIPPTPDDAPQFPSPIMFETQSQWGNGGNGASFVPGRGWVAAPPPPLQPLLPGNPPLSYTGSYAQIGGGRR